MKILTCIIIIGAICNTVLTFSYVFGGELDRWYVASMLCFSVIAQWFVVWEMCHNKK